MPIITIWTYSGRTQREKDRLAEAITDDAVKLFGVEKKDVVIVFQEEPHGNWYAEGRTYQVESWSTAIEGYAWVPKNTR
jgi:4-oxalocrotonate tautomerase